MESRESEKLPPWKFLTAESFIQAAAATDPNFKKIISVAAIFAIVVIFSRFGVALATLVWGSLAILGIAVIYLLVAQASRLRREKLNVMAAVVVLMVLLLLASGIICIILSVFLNKPLPFRDWITRSLVKPVQLNGDLSDNSDEQRGPAVQSETSYK
jgi:ABC-type transport system involved in multi-copper enzyme maturation permease subunit